MTNVIATCRRPRVTERLFQLSETYVIPACGKIYHVTCDATNSVRVMREVSHFITVSKLRCY